MRCCLPYHDLLPLRRRGCMQRKSSGEWRTDAARQLRRKVFQRFADLVSEYSDGEMLIKMYPNEQLGKTDRGHGASSRSARSRSMPRVRHYMKKWVDEIAWIERRLPVRQTSGALGSAS